VLPVSCHLPCRSCSGPGSKSGRPALRPRHRDSAGHRVALTTTTLLQTALLSYCGTYRWSCYRTL
jgi:hypothetical protein